MPISALDAFALEEARACEPGDNGQFVFVRTILGDQHEDAARGRRRRAPLGRRQRLVGISILI